MAREPISTNVGMDVIRDSLGMGDDDFTSQSGEGDLDLDGDESDDGQDPNELDGDIDGPDDLSDDLEPAPQRRPKDDLSKRPDPNRRPDPQGQRPAPLRFDPRAQPRMDAKGNVVDPRTGEVLAKAGSEARIYNRVYNQAQQFIRTAGGNFQNRLNAESAKVNKAVEIGLAMEAELTELRSQNASVSAFQLQPQELVEAAQLFSQAKRDPLSVLRTLLTRAQVSGIDLTQLGLKPGSIDPKSFSDLIQSEIAKATKPIQDLTARQQREQATQQEDAKYLRQAEEIATKFFNENPAAQKYGEVFKRVLSIPENGNMPLGEIWAKLQLHLMRRGIDPNRGPSRQQRQNLQNTRQQRRSLPNGRSMTPAGSDRRQQDGPASVSMSYDDILREVLGNTPLTRV